MGMIGNLTRVAEETRISLFEAPERINQLLYPEFDELPQPKQGLLARLFGKKQEAKVPSPPIDSIPEDDSMDLDKTWHALHFLFTGSDWEGDFPNGFLVSCGEPVGDVDVGYGPAKAFTPTQVSEIMNFLENLDLVDLRKRFDPKKMHEMEIYPSIWDNSADPDQELEYVFGGLDELRDFVKETVSRQMALLVYIN